MIGLYLVTGRRVAGSWSKAVWPMVVAYAFAWTGHFFIEGNRPATFLYPSYSLMVSEERRQQKRRRGSRRELGWGG